MISSYRIQNHSGELRQRSSPYTQHLLAIAVGRAGQGSAPAAASELQCPVHWQTFFKKSDLYLVHMQTSGRARGGCSYSVA